jgi:DnaK suppressor protein
MRASLQLSPVRQSELSEARLAELRGLLLAETATLAGRSAEHQALITELRDLTDADSVLERELAEAGAVRAQEALADVEHALGRLENGTYGWCEDCGVPMPFERLEAIPWARLCVACPGRRSGWQR